MFLLIILFCYLFLFYYHFFILVNKILLSQKNAKPDMKNNSHQTEINQCLETGLSWHYGAQLRTPPETPRTSLHYRIEWFKGDLRKWKYSFHSVTTQRVLIIKVTTQHV